MMDNEEISAPVTIHVRWQQGEEATAHLNTFGFCLRKQPKRKNQKSLNFCLRTKNDMIKKYKNKTQNIH